MSTPSSDANPTQPGDPPRLEATVIDAVARVAFPRRKIDGIAVHMLYEHAATLSENRQPRMIVDLAGVPLISSGVMGILVTINKLFRHVDGQLHIVCPDPLVVQQFDVMNLSLILKLFPNEQLAMQQFK